MTTLLKSPTFASIVLTACKDKGMNPRNLAANTRLDYDTVRAIVAGEEFPDEEFLTTICEELQLDLVEMRALIQVDRDADSGPNALEKLL